MVKVMVVNILVLVTTIFAFVNAVKLFFMRDSRYKNIYSVVALIISVILEGILLLVVFL